MSQHAHHDHELEQLRCELDAVAREVHELTDVLARSFANGEVAALSFDGSKGISQVTDDKGSNALAYAIYNNTKVDLFVSLAGAGPQSGLEVPAQKLVVAPITVNGAVDVAADATQLAETRITVLRWRFPTPQAFYVGDLE
jgi:hypothetical protein